MRLSGQIPYLEHLVRRLSGGRLGVLDLAGLPSIELTVTGRKSGLPRTTPLLYVPYRDAYLLVGSNWGQRQHPAWSINLLHTDKAAVHQNGERFDVTVTHLSGTDRDRAWQHAIGYWPGYAMERRLAGEREFPLFELRRLG